MANELFVQKGFDGMSIMDILENTQIARGTLYYHFKSKEEIMDALISRTTTQMLSKAQEIAADQTLPVTERMIRVVMALNISDGSAKELIEHIHKPQNALMHPKMQKAVLDGVTPILSELVSEGIAEGQFISAIGSGLTSIPNALY